MRKSFWWWLSLSCLSLSAFAEIKANSLTHRYLRDGDAAFRIAFEADAQRVQRVYFSHPITFSLTQQEMANDLKRVERLYDEADYYYGRAEQEHYRSTGTHEVRNAVQIMKADARDKLRKLQARHQDRMIQSQLQTLALLAASSSSSYSSSGASSTSSYSSSASSPKSWSFVGCYKDGFDCRVRFVNNYYCKSSWLGSSYECLTQEKTAPHACYCYQ